MKKIALVGITLALFASIENACAAGSAPIAAGTFGLSVSTAANTMITGKYIYDSDMAILGGFGLTQVGNGGASNTYVMGGVRKYTNSQNRSDSFTPFVGGRIWDSSTSQNNTSTNTFGIAGEVGAEYFFSKRFSLEGAAAIGYSTTTPSGGTGTSTLSTSLYSLGANFYF